MRSRVHNQRELLSPLRKFKYHHYRLQHLNETSRKVWKRMDQWTNNAIQQ